jgi:anaerobic magnesium-protoporphyrin IX monomethyl ester cyclase
VILLTHSYHLHFDQKQLLLGKPYPPLGMLYASAVLQQAGMEVACHDPMFSKNLAPFTTALHQHQPNYMIVYDDGFNYLNKMCLSNMRDASIRMAKEAKLLYKCITIIVSSDSSDRPLDYLQNGFDYVIAGEGEMALLQLINTINGGGNGAASPSVITMLNETLVQNTKLKVMDQLDILPHPAWEQIDLVPYKKTWLKKHGYFSLNLSTTRGCPFKCNWCSKPIYGNRYHAHSVGYVIEEIRKLQSLGATHLWITDDIFGLKPGWVKLFADTIKAEGIKISYKIQSRVDLLLEETQIKHLSTSGCDEVWVGAESGSQRILDAMDKGTKVEQIMEACSLMKLHGIRPCLFLQFGYLGEQAEDIKQTIEMVNYIKPYDIGVSVSYPLPGTEFYESVKSQLVSKTHWVDSDELVTLYQATYPTDCYKKLQRYVHGKFRWAQFKSNLRQGRLNHWRYLFTAPYHGLHSFLLKHQLKTYFRL